MRFLYSVIIGFMFMFMFGQSEAVESYAQYLFNMLYPPVLAAGLTKSIAETIPNLSFSPGNIPSNLAILGEKVGGEVLPMLCSGMAAGGALAFANNYYGDGDSTAKSQTTIGAATAAAVGGYHVGRGIQNKLIKAVSNRFRSNEYDDLELNVATADEHALKGGPVNFHYNKIYVSPPPATEPTPLCADVGATPNHSRLDQVMGVRYQVSSAAQNKNGGVDYMDGKTPEAEAEGSIKEKAY